MFFDDALNELITEISNLHATQNSKQLAITPSGIGLVIATLLVSGYFPLVNIRMYWEGNEDVHSAAVNMQCHVNKQF